MSFPRYPAYKDSGVEWLGEVPEGWNSYPLRSLARPGRDCFIDGDWIESPYITDEGIRLIQTGNIGTGIYREQGFRYISPESFEQLGCTEVSPGDVLICRLAEPVGRACLAPRLGSRMITSVDVAILKPGRQVNPKFLVYALSSGEYLGYMESQCRGGTRDRVSRSFLGSVRIALSQDPQEQAIITTFLDRETAKIDALVADYQALIELLQEKHQAIISHAVTKGLDPTVLVKDSGVEWLGEVPEHWDVVRLAELLREANDTGEEDLPILTVSIHHGVSDKEYDESELERKVTRSDDRSKYKTVRPGDLVYNMMRAWQGGFGAVIVDGLVSPAYVVARPIRQINTSFVEQVLRCPTAVEEMRRRSHGVTDFRLRLYWQEFKDIRIAIPPLEEQTKTMRLVERQTEKFDHLVTDAQEAITLLQERRTALISAAVTGKIDVRGLVETEVV